jgi:hypothetical protein
MNSIRNHTFGNPAAAISLPASVPVPFFSFFLLVLLSLLAITGLLLLRS